MHDQRPLGELRRILTRQGFPASYIERAIQEIADHREDLQAEVNSHSPSDFSSESLVNDRLGDPVVLATGFKCAMRQASWWGRHPIFNFCFLPVILFTVSLITNGWIGYELVGGREILEPSESAQIIAAKVAHGFQYAAIVGICILFFWLALRSYCGWPCACATAAILSLHGLVHFIEFRLPMDGGQGSVMWGYGLTTRITTWDFYAILIPQVILALFYICRVNSTQTNERLPA